MSEMVRAEMVCKSFGALQVLKGVTLSVERGQVLVLQDLLGIYTGVAAKKPADYKAPRFAKNFLAETGTIQQAIAHYVMAVKNKTFPATEHSY